AAGARSATARQAAVLDLEQALVHQPVEVELHHVAGQAGVSCGLVATDRLRLRNDVQVEVAAGRLAERTRLAQPPRQLFDHELPILKDTALVERNDTV